MRKRGQASSEYIIILAVVIILALVAVAVLGGFVNIGGEADDNAAKAYWRSAPIGILNWELAADGAVRMVIRNNLDTQVRILAVNINSQNLITRHFELAMGASQELTGQINPPGAGENKYSKDVEIIYESGRYGLQNAFTGKEDVVGEYTDAGSISGGPGVGPHTTTVAGGGSTTTLPAGATTTSTIYSWDPGHPLPSSGLYCEVKQTCGANQIPIMRLSAAGNAHAQLVTATPAYPSLVCCQILPSGTLTVGAGTTIVKLSADTNAHAEKPAGTAYTGFDVQLQAGSGTVACTYPAALTACTADETCVVTLSGDTNAHVTSCAAGDFPYFNPVCCKIT